ncbi:MAG: hypothetical protein FWC67_01560, partial [Defluviitaleaceae bacterium]|nr:hypothetical protein [Defluviitaleaceae bacterium]
NILFPMVFIVLVTASLIGSMFFRSKAREHQQNFVLKFENYDINVQVMRFARFMMVSVRYAPDRLLPLGPPVSCHIMKNGKKVLSVPNFWLNFNGLGIVHVTKNDALHMDILLNFKDGDKAESFISHNPDFHRKLTQNCQISQNMLIATLPLDIPKK